jgi:hypothetical protein
LSDIFPTLGVTLSGTLFQNLQTLGWEHIGDDFYYIHLFLRPSLTKLDVVVTSDSASSLLSTLMLKCPKLIDVHVQSRGHIDLRSVTDIVRGLKYAERISVPSLDEDIFEHLSRLPTLRSLAIQFLPTTFTLSPVRRASTFPLLRQLIFAFPEIAQVNQFLRWCSAVPLETFHASFCEVVTANDLRAVFTAISAGFSHSYLLDLTIGTHPQPPTIRFRLAKRAFSGLGLD